MIKNGMRTGRGLDREDEGDILSESDRTQLDEKDTIYLDFFNKRLEGLKKKKSELEMASEGEIISMENRKNLYKNQIQELALLKRGLKNEIEKLRKFNHSLRQKRHGDISEQQKVVAGLEIELENLKKKNIEKKSKMKTEISKKRASNRGKINQMIETITNRARNKKNYFESCIARTREKADVIRAEMETLGEEYRETDEFKGKMKDFRIFCEEVEIKERAVKEKRRRNEEIRRDVEELEMMNEI